MYHSDIPPLVAGATTFPPQAGALWVLSHGAMSLQERIECFILPPEQGAVRRSRIGGGERSKPIRRMLIIPYDIESQSRNVLASPLGEEGHEVAKGCTRVRMIMTLDMDVPAERRHYNTHRPRGRYHNPRPEGPSNLRTFRPKGPVHPKNPFPQPFYTTRRR